MTDLAKYIDHTALKPEATQAEILKLTDEAKKFGFASVCVNPCWVAFAAEQLKNSNVEVCTVIGFPLGASTAETKAFETKDAISKGADEVDMVINIGALKSGQEERVEADIHAVVQAADKRALVKVIIEACLLSNDEKTRACQLAVNAGADYVKTSTGFSTGGATPEDVALMRKTVGEKIGVKAAGGIHSKADAEAMIAAGASRIGASSGVKIIAEGL
jgi:deoxyribose-phosphate aldolase